MRKATQKWVRKSGVAVFSFILFACGGASNPDATIRRAYDWYVQMVQTAQDPWQRARIDLEAMATDRFITSIETARPELGGTGLIDGRTVDARLAVENVKVTGRAATARVMVSGRMIGRQMLSVYLLKEDRRWKIDDVKLIDSE